MTTLVGLTDYNSAASTSATCNVPAGINNGDIMFMRSRFSNSLSSQTFPSGRTLLWNGVGNETSSDAGVFALHYRIASSEPASYAVTSNVNARVRIIIVGFRGGFSTDNPINVTSTGNYTTANTILRANSITVSNNNSNIFYFGNCVDLGSGGASFTPPSGREVDLNTNNEDSDVTTLIGHKAIDAGNSGNIDVTMSSIYTNKGAVVVALNPVFGTAHQSTIYRKRELVGQKIDDFNSYINPSYGYFAGGFKAGNITATTDRITFSTGATAANTVSNLSQARYGVTGISDGSTYGYFAGGDGDSNTRYATTDRIVFSTGTISANTVSNLSGVRKQTGGLSDGTTYGYFSGGVSGTTRYTTTDRITFSTGATAVNTVSNLSQARLGLAGVSDGSTYGYMCGGNSAAYYYTTTDRITFSTGATAVNTVSNLSQARYGVTGLSDKTTYGYVCGGLNGTTEIATTDRITFSTGATAANTVSNLSQARYGVAGASDGGTYGYICGGHTTETWEGVNTSDRIIFSTGVTAANTVSNLSSGRLRHAGLSDCSI